MGGKIRFLVVQFQFCSLKIKSSTAEDPRTKERVMEPRKALQVALFGAQWNNHLASN